MAGYISRSIIAASLVLLLGGSVSAQISPGPLSRFHASLEGVDNCNRCHDPDHEALAANCLACHGLISDQQQSRKGLHSDETHAACEMCHVEHHGEDFDLVYFKDGMDSFDHRQTGYSLDGAHVRLICRDCHRPEKITDPSVLKAKNVNLSRTFQGLTDQCASCHTDQHRGQLGKDCRGCHNTTAWKPAAGFSHDQSRFPLTGRHVDLDCTKCHRPSDDAPPTMNYRPIAYQRCLDCHRDPHQSRLGEACAKCHTTAGWSQVRTSGFDHNKTRYPLLGRHTTVACERCHGDRNNKADLAFARCTDCHRDFHHGEFGDRPQGVACEQCHTVKGFTPALFSTVQHDSTDYPLIGAHLAVPCDNCHIEQVDGSPRYRFVFASTNCRQCHVDPHRGQVDRLMAKTGCTHCHTVEDWAVINFDHAATKFALAGKHVEVRCLACHSADPENNSPAELRFAPVATDCATCHKDPHRGQFALNDQTDCRGCHTANDWRQTTFDHAKARFALDGAHQKVPCAGCHMTVQESDDSYVKYKPLDYRCIDCHASARSKRGQES